MSKKLQNMFVVCAMILAFVAWILFVFLLIKPCANQVKEGGYEDAYSLIWLLTQIISWVVGAVTGRVGYKLMAQINGWDSKD